MKPFLHYLRAFSLFAIIFSLPFLSFAANITSLMTGTWSATAWPNTLRSGTITTSNASPTVTGVGTAFTTQISVGNIIKTAGNVVIGTVLTVNSATSITLTSNAASTNAGIAYNVQGIGSADNALILGGTTIVIDNAGAVCASLASAAVGANSPWDIVFNAGSHLTVGGNVAVGGAGLRAGNIDMTLGGILTCRSFTVPNAGTWAPGAGTVELSASNTLPATFLTNFNNLTITLGNTNMAVALTISGNLSIANGGTTNFTDGGFALTVNGTTSVGGGVSGNLTISSAVAAKIFIGLVTINTGAFWINSGNSDILFQGGITNSGTFTSGTGIQTFNTNNQSITGTFDIPNVTVNGVTLTNNSTLTVSNALTGTGTLVQGVNSILNINFAGALGISGLTATSFGNIVNYEFGGPQTVFSTNYYNLSLSNNSVKTLQVGTTSMGGTFMISGTASTTAVVGLTVGVDANTVNPGSTFNTGTFNHIVDGNFNNNGVTNAGVGTITVVGGVNNGGIFNGSATSIVNVAGNVNNSGTFNANGDSLVFDGSTIQTLTNTGGGSIDNLKVNNSDVGIQLENNISITTSLTMTQGNIDLNGTNLGLGIPGGTAGILVRTIGTIINGGTFTRGFNASTIPDGSIAGLFPVGTLTNYQPISISAPVTPPSAAGAITVAYLDASGKTPVHIPDPPNIIVVIDNFSWVLSTLGGLTGGTYNLDAAGTAFGSTTNVTDLRLSLNNAVVGIPGINGGTTINPQVNRINLSLSDLTNSFFIGSIDSTTSSLPISLISFTATPVNGEVKLDWETASEFNNDHFSILRSTNTVSWENIDQIPGSGNTSVDTKYTAYDEKPLGGVSYYRLQQTDWDGRQSYSSIVSVGLGLSTTIIIYPNPATDFVFISNIITAKMGVNLVNSNGQQMNLPILINATSMRLNVSELPPGTYFLNIIQNGTNLIKTIIKN